ncbi:MAG: hypothetical protein ACJATI_002882 [Halioglobus sp.]|jgi:hypothetical protein
MRNLAFVVLLIVSLSSCTEKAIINDFKPIKFDWSVDQPIFIKKGNKLFLKDINNESKLIYSYSDTKELYRYDAYVSPDSESVLIEDSNELHLININDLNKNTISVDSLIKWEIDLVNQYSMIQWSKDSKFIGILCEEDGLYSKENSLFIYDVEADAMISKLALPSVLSFFFSKDGKSVFYKYFDTPNSTSIQEIVLFSGQKNKEYPSYPDSNLFVNIFPSRLYNHSTNLEKVIVDSWKYDSNLILKPGNYILYADSIKLLLEASESSENFKEFKFSNHNSKMSYFLPGNRYYIFVTSSKQYTGFLIFDTLTREYMKIEDAKFYYALNSNHFGETKNSSLNYLKNYNRSNIKEKGFKIIY